MAASISVTAAAKAALERLKKQHGDIVMHLTGGCCDARTPLVLNADDLKLGARDGVFGQVEGVTIYEMQGPSDAEGDTCPISKFVLDVTDGLGVGFSLEAAPGKRFTLRNAA